MTCQEHFMQFTYNTIYFIKQYYRELCQLMLHICLSANTVHVFADAPSGHGFIMMVLQRLRVFLVHCLLIPSCEPHKFLWPTKCAMFLTACSHKGFPRFSLWSERSFEIVNYEPRQGNWAQWTVFIQKTMAGIVQIYYQAQITLLIANNVLPAHPQQIDVVISYQATPMTTRAHNINNTLRSR